jgi:hypothetical protein
MNKKLKKSLVTYCIIKFRLEEDWRMHATSNATSTHWITTGLIFLTLSFLGGCASDGGRYNKSSGTIINLEKNNYTMIKPAATGSSMGFKLFGIIPFKNPTYAEAKQNLYGGLGESLAGRSIALANQSEDSSTLYLILFSLPRLTISADIVEFKEGGASPAQSE